MNSNAAPWEVWTLTRNKVEICGVDTSKLPVLTNAEMRELFVELQQNGNREAREKLVNGNLRLVLSVIQRFNNRGEYVDDLFQVGCIGLMKAIDNFDEGLKMIIPIIEQCDAKAKAVVEKAEESALLLKTKVEEVEKGTALEIENPVTGTKEKVVN